MAVLTATLNEDEFIVDVENTEEESKLTSPSLDLEQRSRKDQFLLSALESKIDKTNKNQLERFSHIKNQVIEKIKTTKLRRSMSSTSSKRRLSFLGNDSDTPRSQSRPRTLSPSAQ